MCPSRFLTKVALISFLMLMLLHSACQPRNNVIRIGMTAPLTGATSESGIALQQGVDLAVEEINANGGVNVGGKQYKIEVFVEDSEAEPEAGVSAAERLITKEKVHYLIGDAFHSSVTMAIMELAPRYKIPIVSGESVSEAIVDKVKADPDRYRYYWKMNYGSTAYADTVFNTVEWLLDEGEFQPHARAVFFIVEDTDYGRSNARETAKLFEGVGWTTAAIETVPLGHTEFHPQLNKLREADADVLVSVFTSLSSGVALVKQFQELGVEALHMAVYYPSLPELIQQAGDAAEGLLWTPLVFDPEHIDSHQAFAEKIQDKFSVEATMNHAYGYDAIYNAADSISRAGSLKPEDIIEGVAALDRKGVIGRYVFDQSIHQAKAGPEFIPIPTAQIQEGEDLIVWPEQLATAEYQPQPWVK
jgi:branched-chain amino acid transport system substrate-binding protein